MRRRTRYPLMLLLALLCQWSGPPERPMMGRVPDMTATPVPFDASNPKRVKTGALTFMGGLRLTSRDPAFGGYSSMTIDRGLFTLLSDGGTILRFRLDDKFRPSAIAFGDLPVGPGTGWNKADRDSESMTLDPASGRAWVGYERVNQIWRYSPGLTQPAQMVAPQPMADWSENGGAESMVRLHDGRFLVIAETSRRLPSQARSALMFDRDPTATPLKGFEFGYLPPDGYDPSDATQLPDGRVVILNRKLALPLTWSAVLTLIDPRHIRPGVTIRGREIARLAPPLTVDNFEGLAITREKGATMVWMCSDDNLLFLQQTLLMKFRLDL